ncbi:hypothetical protein GCM10027440_33160 [Nocardiopsis coralliicola]
MHEDVDALQQRGDPRIAEVGGVPFDAVGSGRGGTRGASFHNAPGVGLPCLQRGGSVRLLPADGHHPADRTGTQSSREPFHQEQARALGGPGHRDRRTVPVRTVLWANLAVFGTHSGVLPANVTVETNLILPEV